jgi:hypothetical protein
VWSGESFLLGHGTCFPVGVGHLGCGISFGRGSGLFSVQKDNFLVSFDETDAHRKNTICEILMPFNCRIVFLLARITFL